MPPYEPEVIELFAAQLQRRAKTVRRGFAVAGMLLGALFGSFPLTSLGNAWPIPHIFGFTTLLLGAAVGAFIGWVVGEGRAAMYRMHAQTTLCQLHAQRTTLAIWRLLQERPDDAFRRTELPRMNATESVVEEQRALEVFTEESAVEVLTEQPALAVPASGPAIEVRADEESPAEDDALAELDPEPEPEPLPEPEPEPVFAPAARLVPPPATPTLTAVEEPENVAEPFLTETAEPVPAPPESPAPFVPVSAPAPRTAPDLVPVSAPPVEPFVPVSVPKPAPEPPPPPFVPVSVPAPPAQAYEPAPGVAARAVPSSLRQASNGVPPLLPPPLSD